MRNHHFVSSLTLPVTARDVLPNGTVVISHATRVAPALTFHIVLRAGTIFEPRSRCGVSHILAGAIEQGLTGGAATEVAETVDANGALLSVGVDPYSVTLRCTCVAEDFSDMLRLVAGELRSLSCPDAAIERVRDEMLTAIRLDDMNPPALAMQRILALLHPEGHPLGRPLKGDLPGVEGTTVGDVREFHAARVAASPPTVVVAGGVSRERAVDAVAAAFDTWPSGGIGAVALAPPAPSPVRRVERIGPCRPQAEIAYGFVTIARTDPTFHAARLMNVALGQYVLGGRLGARVRERDGLAYSVGSSLRPSVVAGPLIVRAGVHPSNVHRAIAAIDEEIDHIRTAGIDAQELAHCKAFVIGSTARLFGSDDTTAAALQELELFGVPLDESTRLPDLFEVITVDHVNDAARHLLDARRASIVVAGAGSA